MHFLRYFSIFSSIFSLITWLSNAVAYIEYDKNSDQNHNYHNNHHRLKQRYRSNNPINENFNIENDQQVQPDYHVKKAQCLTDEPTVKEIETSNNIARQWLDDHPCENYGLANPKCTVDTYHRSSSPYLGQVRYSTMSIKPIEIQTHFHVIYNNLDGNLSDNTIQKSMDVLGKAFHPYFKFVFNVDQDVTRHLNYWWFYDIHAHQYIVKGMLRKGDCSVLNIYSARLAMGLYGFATYPMNCANNPIIDGVVVSDVTVPGGSASMYNEGKTLVHEVGHWLGLFHTFMGGCGTGGDEVSDTPAQGEPTQGCPIGKDSCPYSRGLDPIHNYMDYSYDWCMNEFTPGQFSRMISQWEMYRYVAIPTPVPTPMPTPMPTPIPTRIPTRIPTIIAPQQRNYCNVNIKGKGCRRTPCCVWKSSLQTCIPNENCRLNTRCETNKDRIPCRKSPLCCLWRNESCISKQVTTCRNCRHFIRKWMCRQHGCCTWDIRQKSCFNKAACPNMNRERKNL